MLDKSVPYFDLAMHRRAGTPLPSALLPPGYSLVAFQPGDEAAWATIETAVLEFSSETKARQYFCEQYLGCIEEARRRVFFVRTPEGDKVGTTTVWWTYTGKQRVVELHWVGLKPEYQGKGIGKAMVALAMQECLEIEGEVDVDLHTQTWSYLAIGIYLQVGFKLMPEGSYGRHKNSYHAALPVLRSKMSADTLALI
jgi:RimJ/RimL family protein N-acetyltransferase